MGCNVPITSCTGALPICNQTDMSGCIITGTAGNVQSSSGAPIAPFRFNSFDGAVEAEGLLQQPDRYRFWSSEKTDYPIIARGAGLSYAAASFSSGGVSIEHGSFNRVLDFDSERRVVEVEAGIELATLHAFLSTRGLYLPIQPGHGRISVGGCIAADIHGKNQAKDGTFINQVSGLTLFHPSHGFIEVSPTLEPDLFRLTCGGYGLTGHIVSARLRASPIPSHIVEVKAIPVPDLGSGVKLLVEKALESDFAYSWHDFMSSGTSFGQGYVYLGRFSSHGEAPSAVERERGGQTLPILSSTTRASWHIPLFNRFSTRMLNLAFRGKQRLCGLTKRIDLRDALFPIHATQFYFKLFGARGFHEYQVIIPSLRTHDYLDAVRGYLSHHPMAVTLASAKCFKGNPELLRFSGDGVCFAINVPRTAQAKAFFAFLDELILSVGGIPNIIKDSRLPRSVVDACYPEAQRFRDQLLKFDPDRIFRSELSERLGL
jgi:decaprenylphospho-beta-D-ribofuranose 2-oxidase